MSDLSDEELAAADRFVSESHDTTPEFDAQYRRMRAEIDRRRAALRRVQAVLSQLEQRTQCRASQVWAAELRSAITGRAYLYRCPKHGDRRPISTRHERGVNCGQPLPFPWERPHGSVCTETAELVGEVDIQ